MGGRSCNSIMKELEGRPALTRAKAEPGQQARRPRKVASSIANIVMSSVKRHRVVTPNGKGRLFAATAFCPSGSQMIRACFVHIATCICADSAT